MSLSNRLSDSQHKCYCAHAGEKVTLKTSYVYPADHLPDGPARIANRSCSHFFDCNLQDKSACTFNISFNEPVDALLNYA